uniref:Uncharacterized protein n=1 Tax=Rhizophora mucronata TaxID=61149 RepID=A0A2P2ND29_RHIMU
MLLNLAFYLENANGGSLNNIFLFISSSLSLIKANNIPMSVKLEFLWSLVIDRMITVLFMGDKRVSPALLFCNKNQSRLSIIGY